MFWLSLALFFQTPSLAQSLVAELEQTEIAKCDDGCAETDDVELLQLRAAVNADGPEPALVEVEQFRAAAGTKLGRYTLVEKVMSSDLGSDLGSAEGSWDAADGMYRSLGASYRNESRLGKGACGEVFKAFDLEAQSEVAVKIFIHNKPYRHLTWDGADLNQRDRHMLQLGSAECDMAQQIVQAAEAAHDHAGASSILKCLKNGVVSQPGQHIPSHLVLEPGGPTVDHWLEARKNWTRASHGDLTEGRRIIAGILLGLRAMEALNPPVVHHDLKPENVMAFNQNGSFIVKVIDFGMALNGTEENMNIGRRGSWSYYAREVMEYMVNPKNNVTEWQASYSKTFMMPAWSYDVYSVGEIYLQLVCPGDIVTLFKTLPEPYTPGLAKRILDAPVGKDGGKLCAELGDDELALIESMIGPHEERPRPSVLLKHPLLAKVLEEQY